MPINSSRRCVAVGLLGLALLAGCQRKEPGAAAARDMGSYLAPPTLLAADHAPGGSVRLVGRSPAGALVLLRSPEGGEARAVAAADGGWSIALPAGDAPRLYAVEGRTGRRVLKGEGALAILPPPFVPALVLRSGYAAAPVGRGLAGRLELIGLDFDGGGAAAYGFASPGSPVRLLIDNGPVGVTRAAPDGRFAVVAVDPQRGVGPGSHLIRLEAQGALSAERRVEVIQPSLPPDKVYGVNRDANGWSLTWRTPAGGLQTSLIFDPAQGGLAR